MEKTFNYQSDANFYDKKGFYYSCFKKKNKQF